MNHKTGSKKVEYSINELLSMLKARNMDGICPELYKILTRAEAVRFSPVLSQDSLMDLKQIKQLLKEVDRGWK